MALLVVWTVVWYVYLRNFPPSTQGPYYWCAGFLATGVTLLVIGLALGRIGRAARHAELPPPEAAQQVAAETMAAAQAPPPAAVVVPAPDTRPIAATPGVPAAARAGESAAPRRM